MRLWPRTIRWQLIVAVAGIHLVLMTLFVGDLVLRQRRLLLADSVNDTRTLAQTIAVSSASWVLANDVEGLQEVVRAVQTGPDFRYLMILTRDGRILAHSDETRRGLFVRDERSLELLSSKPELRTVWAGADSVDVAAPILSSQGDCLGWARVGRGQAAARANLAAVTRSGAAYTLLAAAFGAALAIVVGRRLTKGLHGLVQVSAGVRDGRRDVRARTGREDEIGQLGRGLNEMLDTLADEERRVRLLLESTAEGILGSDLAGRCTFSNPAALSLLGYSSSEALQGKDVHDLIHHHRADGSGWPADGCRVRNFLTLGSTVHADDEVFWRPDGTSFPVEYRAHPILRDGKAIGLVITFTDVTMRRRAEQEVRRANELLERMFESIHVSVAYMDRNFNFIRVNRSYAAADEHEPEYYLGKNHFVLFPNAENEALFRRVVETGEPLQVSAKPFEYASNPERGITYWDWRLEPVTDPSGGVLGVVLSLLDVTPRIQAESTRAHLAAMIESSVEAIIGKDLEGRITSWNLGAERTYGYSAAEVLGRPIRILVPPGREDESTELIARVRRGEEISRYETVRVRKDGTRIDVSLTLSPIRTPSGLLVGISAVVRDITERKRAEEEVRRLNVELEARVKTRTAELETANKELEAFSYSVSHDLRAPLRAIDGFSREIQALYSERLDDEGLHLLTRVRENATRMSSLIEGLLHLSRVGRHDLRRSALDMAGLARAVWEELLSTDTGPPAELRLAPIPPAAGDAALVRQVWTNLLSNALKFSAKSERRLVEIGSAAEGEETIYFVKDNGAGFDPAYAGKLFGAFQRLHTTSEFEGTGIGLAIVLRVIRRHGGRVWADAAPGRGATFSFTLGGEPEPEPPPAGAAARIGARAPVS